MCPYVPARNCLFSFLFLFLLSDISGASPVKKHIEILHIIVYYVVCTVVNIAICM